MDFDVVTVVMEEHELFEIPEYVEELEMKDKKFRESGVLKICLSSGICRTGSTLQDFFKNFNNARLAKAVKKLIPVAFQPDAQLYGHRQFLHVQKNVGNEVAESPLCTKSDIDEFINRVYDPNLYSGSASCCINILKEQGMEAMVEHFFNDVLRAMSVPVHNKNKKLSVESKRHTDENYTKSFQSFLQKLKGVSAESRAVMVASAKLTDVRCVSEGCNCEQCSETVSPTENYNDLKGKGILYGVGVVSSDGCSIKMTKNFGLDVLCTISILRQLNKQYVGITCPLLYIGVAHSFSALHIEPMSLYNISFLHHGCPKIWLVIPPHAVSKLDLFLSISNTNIFHSSCRNSIGHSYFIPTTKWLKNLCIPFKVVMQKEGEAVVVKPNAAHFVFNTGSNIAEACNFGNKLWIPYGMVSPKCVCLGKVYFDMGRIISIMRPELLRAWETGKLPNAGDVLDSYFWRSTMCTYIKNQRNFEDVKQGFSSEISHDSSGSLCDEINNEFPNDVSIKKGRKRLICPKSTCGASYAGGQKNRLIRHVKKVHAQDSKLPMYLMELDYLFPSRDKSERRKCNLCLKMIAGRASQMKIHQKSSGCRKIT